MLPNWQLLNIVNTQEDVILAVSLIGVSFLITTRYKSQLLLALDTYREEICRSGDSNPDILADTSF